MTSFKVVDFQTYVVPPTEKCYVPECKGERCAFARLICEIGTEVILKPVCATHKKSMQDIIHEQGGFFIASES